MTLQFPPDSTIPERIEMMRAESKSDPYAIHLRPALISFSGGRSSAYMLYHILERHGGLPDDIKVVFANTGKEHPKTLDFVQRCSEEWSVDIPWIEYDRYGGRGHRFRLVNHNSASRRGEPFRELVQHYGVPSAWLRICTGKLKVDSITSFGRRTQAWKRWSSIIGYRADEQPRIAKMYRCSDKFNPQQRTGMIPQLPMAEAGVLKSDVDEFWRKQSFDLGIRSIDGNCDFCFMKRRSVLIRKIREDPDAVNFWIEMEEMTREAGYEVWTFLSGESYADIKREALSQTVMPFMDEDDDGGGPIDCACGVD